MDINKFQWKRVGMLWRLYYPAMRWQIVVYPVMSVALTGLMALGQKYGHVLFPTTVCSFIMSLAYSLAPISLTRRDYRPVSETLPVTAGEKLAFLLLCYGVGMFLLVQGPYWLLQLAFSGAVPNPHSISTASGANVDINFGWWVYPYSFINAFTVIPVVLWAIVVSKTNRAGMAIGALVATTMAESMVGGMVGFVFALTHLDDLKSPDDIFNVGEMMKYVFALSALLILMIIGVFIPMLYNKLKHRGF